MKKNLLSIIILALLIINLVMTAIMMISVTGTNKKTSAIVTDIASILKLELDTGDGTAEAADEMVSMEDTAVYDIADEMTILLTQGADGKSHFAIVKVSLSMDTKNKGYKTYGETISERESLIKGEISDAIGKYTADEVRPRSDDITQEILTRLQTMFDSDFIYKVTFSELIVQ